MEKFPVTKDNPRKGLREPPMVEQEMISTKAEIDGENGRLPRQTERVLNGR